MRIHAHTHFHTYNLRVYPYVFTGSSDGVVKFWRLGGGAGKNKKNNHQQLQQLENLSLPCVGFANALDFDKKGRILVVGVGQEHRLGRWTREKKAKNGIKIVVMPQRERKVLNNDAEADE